MAETAIVFLDVESTGLEFDDEVWEFAAIRREPDGSEREWEYFVDHDPAKCKALPEPFFSDHHKRFPALHDGTWGDGVISRQRLCGELVGTIMEGRPHVIAAVPAFDTERMLGRLLREIWHLKATELPWHYHTADIENFVSGYLLASAEAMYSGSGGNDDVIDRANELLDIAAPPWSSDDLSRAVGVEPSDFQRHTAMGDVRWCRAQWDSIWGVKS